MLSGEIRKRFLDFFKTKDHKIIASDSLVPRSDPSLLFTSAGMNQFKEQFLGHNITYRRAASSQKCLRTADLENVGRTAFHHTFFEMLGNFSFGDYFKDEAIRWAWEFMTEVLKIDAEKLWVSVYREDSESYSIWRDKVRVPDERIVKLGAKDNFWPSNAPLEGPNGPCGPCSEIFYDRGKNSSCDRDTCDPSCDCGRFAEVWNLVFTQFNRREGGRLESLPMKNIDTGMGLERITAVMQGAKTNFETDLFMPIIREIEKYNNGLGGERLSLIADHIRAAAFAICDGIPPSNEERGYVVRKLIRRAYLRAGAQRPFLYNLVPKIADTMKEAYPELIDKREEISLIVKEEEERFQHTLSLAMPTLDENLNNADNNLLNGEKIFKLVDTYGLPLEIIENRADEKKIDLDMEGFYLLMQKRKELSRKKSKLEDDIFSLNLFVKADKPPGSDQMPLRTSIAFMVKEGNMLKEASTGDTVEILTSPQSEVFYAESGGQVGDGGLMIAPGTRIEILNTVKVDEKKIHVCKIINGKIRAGDEIELKLDEDRKKKIARNHTATHLLHSALRKVLGDHVHQAGSFVGADRLRFDFTHTKKMSEREIENVETIVNRCIERQSPVRKEQKPLAEAKNEGAIALFGEKYDEKVTVITAGDSSKEVCGGTHVDNTGDIGVLKIVRESSVASGVRRIEALTHQAATEWIEASRKKEKDRKLSEEKRERDKKRLQERLESSRVRLESILEKTESIGGVKIIAERFKEADINILRRLADDVKSKAKHFFMILGGELDDKAYLVLSVTDDLVSKGINASEVIKEIAKIVDGSGGGRKDFAQAGGKDVSAISEALMAARKIAENAIRGGSR